MKKENLLPCIPILLPISEVGEKSNLSIQDDGELFYNKELMKPDGINSNQHIYLTKQLNLDEIPKHKGWFISYTKLWHTNGKTKTNECHKIICTTNPKLIADGIPTIPQKAFVPKYTTSFDKTRIGKNSVNFLEEYCKRYNQKDNQKEVNVENTMTRENILLKIKKLGTVYTHESLCDSIINSHNQALQSNAGGLSKRSELHKAYCAGANFDHTTLSPKDSEYYMFTKWYESLTKEQPKGDIVIECEMEEEYEPHPDKFYPTGAKWTGGHKIKLVDGKPIIHFKS